MRRLQIVVALVLVLAGPRGQSVVHAQLDQAELCELLERAIQPLAGEWYVKISATRATDPPEESTMDQWFGTDRGCLMVAGPQNRVRIADDRLAALLSRSDARSDWRIDAYYDAGVNPVEHGRERELLDSKALLGRPLGVHGALNLNATLQLLHYLRNGLIVLERSESTSAGTLSTTCWFRQSAESIRAVEEFEQKIATADPGEFPEKAAGTEPPNQEVALTLTRPQEIIEARCVLLSAHGSLVGELEVTSRNPDGSVLTSKMVASEVQTQNGIQYPRKLRRTGTVNGVPLPEVTTSVVEFRAVDDAEMDRVLSLSAYGLPDPAAGADSETVSSDHQGGILPSGSWRWILIGAAVAVVVAVLAKRRNSITRMPP